ncbi:small ribosomal subunit protein mS39-like isoform X2 [Watersipora subatra]|uniref:small ribosomal subunit protein mS39-like isoform X2 n=1 Tax=Watersipora subatra TaxID=2589382 RepID=UPI00355BA27E
MSTKSKGCWRMHKLLYYGCAQPHFNPRLNGRLCHRHCSVTGYGTASSQPNISIPLRIPRGPTTILQALADTVDYDPTDIARYRCIDDPGTISYDVRMTRNSLLAEESGQRAAQYAINRYTYLLQHSQTEPAIEAFTPQLINKEETEDCLRTYISVEKVKEAREMYASLITAEVPVSAETKLMLLDLLCRYNCKEVDYYMAPVQKHFLTETQETWKPDEIIDELFVELSDAHPQVYISLICGMCKFKGYKKAHELYTDAIEKGVLFPVEVHNQILTTLVNVFVNIESVTSEMEKILNHMEQHGIRPNLETFNNLLAQLKEFPAFTKRYSYAQRVFKEMKRCGIEPSAASYMYILDMVYVTRHPRQPDVVKYAVKKFASRRETQPRDPADCAFLKSAMVAASISNDADTAHQLYQLAWKGTNKAFLGTSRNIFVFHNEYLNVLIRTEPMDKLMKAYTDVVPRCLIADNKTYNALFDTIELYGGYHYLPQIFQDIKHGHCLVYLNYERLTQLLTTKGLTSQVYKEFAQIADDIYKLYETNTGYGIAKVMTPTVYSHFIQLALNMKDVEKAWDWFEKYLSHQHYSTGMASPASLRLLSQALIDNGSIDRLAAVLGAMLQLNYKSEVDKLIANNEDNLPGDIRDDLKATPRRRHVWAKKGSTS